MRVRVRLAELLQERGASVARFAREAGVSYPRAAALVRGRAEAVRLDLLERILSWAGCRTDDLLVREKAPAGQAEAFDVQPSQEAERLAERAKRATRAVAVPASEAKVKPPDDPGGTEGLDGARQH